MKKILLLLVSILTVAACNQKLDGYTIAGNLTGEVENGTNVYLKKSSGGNQPPIVVDTAKVENGKFSFKGGATDPELHFIFVDKLEGAGVFILENGAIEFAAQKDSLGVAKTTGTPQNEMFSDYMKESMLLSDRARSIQEDLQKASLSQDEASVSSLKDELKELQDEFKEFELDYIKQNPNALISVLLIDRAISLKSMPAGEIQALYDGLTDGIKGSKAATAAQEKLKLLVAKEENLKNTEVGATAPLFSGLTPDGKELALKDAMGKLTLVDFWAAWCKPCRRENPNIVKVYEKYHDKGLNIVGVSLDRKDEDWKKAIADDGLVWNQIFNVNGPNSIANMYNIESIPAAFLLDENGVIVAKNLRGDQLEEKVAELLK